MNFSKEEIIYHLIDSAIAGALVLAGYFVGAGEMISIKGLLMSMAASGLVFVNKFKDYWSNEKDVLQNRKKRKHCYTVSFI